MASEASTEGNYLHRIAWSLGIPGIFFVVLLIVVVGSSTMSVNSGGEVGVMAGIADFFTDPLLFGATILLSIACGYFWAWFVLRGIARKDRNTKAA